MNLADLPVDDVMRNTALADIGAEYRSLQGSRWNRIGPAFGIARATYNDLALFWRELNERRVV